MFLAGGAQEIPQFARLQPAHDAGERLFGTARRLAAQIAVDAFGGGPALGHGPDKLFDRLDARAGGKNIGRAGAAGGRVGLEDGPGQRQPEFRASPPANSPTVSRMASNPRRKPSRVTSLPSSMPVLKSIPIPRQQRDFGIEDGGGQFAFRHVAQLAAGFGVAVNDGDGVAVPGEVVRRRQAGRPGADDHHGLRVGGGGADRHVPAALESCLAARALSGIVPFADGGRLVENAAAAALFARMMAKAAQHPASGSAWRMVADRLVQAARFDLADHRGNVQLQRAEAMARRKTIPHVVAEKQFQRGAARLVDFLGFAFDDHAGDGLGGAGGHQAALAVGHHLDQANLAGGQRPALFEVAKGWDVQADLPRGLQDRLARARPPPACRQW